MNKKHKFWSIALITFVFVVALIIVVLIENILVTKVVNDYAERDVIISGKASLELVMGQIDNVIVNLNDSVVSFTTKNEDFLWLSQNERKKGNNSDYYVHMAGLIDDMENHIAGSNYEQGWFAYFPSCRQELFCVYNQDIYNYIKDILEKELLYENKGIHFIKINEKPFVFAFYSKNKGWCGSWVELSSVFGSEVYEDRNDMIFEIGDNLPSEGWTKLNTSRAYRTVVNSSMIDLSISEVRYMDVFSSAGSIRFFVFFTIVIICASVFFVQWMYKNMIQPLKKLQTAIETVQQGDLEYRINLTDEKNDIEVMNFEFNHMLEQIRNLKLDMYEMRLKHQKTELRYLSQQVRPHFILNVLNIIYSYQEKDFPQIKQMVMMLTKYFRYIVNVHSDFISLKIEFDQIQNYLEIQKVRYPRQFDYILECDCRLYDVGIPPLIIQSYVENSIKHAISTKELLQVYVGAEYIDCQCYKLTIYDTGAGYAKNILENIQSVLKGEIKRTNGIGVRNSIDRLRILFGENVSIKIFNRESGGACAEMIIPCNWSETDQE